MSDPYLGKRARVVKNGAVGIVQGVTIDENDNPVSYSINCTPHKYLIDPCNLPIGTDLLGLIERNLPHLVVYKNLTHNDFEVL